MALSVRTFFTRLLCVEIICSVATFYTTQILVGLEERKRDEAPIEHTHRLEGAARAAQADRYGCGSYCHPINIIDLTSISQNHPLRWRNRW